MVKPQSRELAVCKTLANYIELARQDAHPTPAKTTTTRDKTTTAIHNLRLLPQHLQAHPRAAVTAANMWKSKVRVQVLNQTNHDAPKMDMNM